MSHPALHALVALGGLILAAALMGVVRNRAMRRRLLFSVVLLLSAAALHLAVVEWPDRAFLSSHGAATELLLTAVGLINTVVTLAFNPWRQDKVSDRVPAVVQDALVGGLGVVAAMFAFQNPNFLTGSAIAAAVIGFAMQDTLANAISGLAIQVEKPFRVGHWVTVASFEGQVVAITWRATKIRTRQGNLVSVPNSTIARESINNYSEPAAPTRLEIVVGCAYEVPANSVLAALDAAARQSPYVRADPPPTALVDDFGSSAITYRLQFWVDDFDLSDRARSSVRTAVSYELRRRNIEIPWPIQIEYSREEKPVDTPERRERIRRAIAETSVFAGLPAETHGALAALAVEALYGHGEAIVREGEAAASMFVVMAGRVEVTVGAERRRVAVTEAGGYFGEMSLLTGDRRTATVSAMGDCTVLEIGGDAFRRFVQGHPDIVDRLAAAAVRRRQELDSTRATLATTHAAEAVSLADRMRQFFGLA
jgi:small-conductance mechanosensitive channel